MLENNKRLQTQSYAKYDSTCVRTILQLDIPNSIFEGVQCGESETNAFPKEKRDIDSEAKETPTKRQSGVGDQDEN